MQIEFALGKTNRDGLERMVIHIMVSCSNIFSEIATDMFRSGAVQLSKCYVF